MASLRGISSEHSNRSVDDVTESVILDHARRLEAYFGWDRQYPSKGDETSRP